MEFVSVVPGLITAIGGLIVAIAAAGLIQKITAFIDRIQL